ncbi:myrosinase 1-like [Maniola hyperantus]|uniref:myrosinase 1-like n=1 Tax=Aphantopus hyperantus TaxID=2795564 RepID=UPI001569804B|nr:myrosinase 1-like [Maniola hyperantus]
MPAMLCVTLLSIFGLLLRASWCLDLKFPPGFQFGAATSAYQVEGAWNVSDKGASIWDAMLHNDPSLIVDGTNGDVACDSYHQWRTDVHMAHDLGLDFYRFSVSWSRILPSGFPNRISKDGVKYYNQLIDGLLKKGVQPVITLYHFDLPQSIQNLGGWANPFIVDWFADYARIVFSLYADRVKTWITINEPLIVCDLIYNMGTIVPMVLEQELGPFLCNKNVLLAHAKAWRIYDEAFKPKYHGKISIANNPIWLEPASEKDEDLAELAREFGAGRYSDPIYSTEGGWPPAVEKLMAEYSKKEGYPYSRLPPFTEEERKLIQGTYDFYSLNHYTTRLVRAAREDEVPGSWYLFGSKELNAVFEVDPKWSHSDWKFVTVSPKGIRHQLNWLKERYNNVPILITENGYATSKPDLYDTGRIAFIRDYLKEILLAINEDGANVIGYAVWSLMDNFEWMFGYTMKYGLYSVDFSDPMRKRSPRASAHYYANVIKHHSLDNPHSSHQKRGETPNSTVMNKCRFILLITIFSLGYLL